MINMDTIQRNHGVTMPLMGSGMFQVTDPQVCKENVLFAAVRGLTAALPADAAVADAIGGCCLSPRWRKRFGFDSKK